MKVSLTPFFQWVNHWQLTERSQAARSGYSLGGVFYMSPQLWHGCFLFVCQTYGFNE